MSRKDLPHGIGEALEAMSPDDLRYVLGQLLVAGATLGEQPAEPAPSRRRPRDTEVRTYRVRIDLRDTKPPVWRRLELSSDLFLNELHEVVQTAFGWTDSHLHQFGSGPAYYDRQTEYYLCPFQVGEGEPGIPEEQVRLDEVLAEVGDILHYCYDFGDDWQHSIKLEAVLPHTPASPRVVCTGGRRPGPLEDCGGAQGYELIAAATDPSHPDHAAAQAEFLDLYGEEVPAHYRLTPLDIEAVNDILTTIDIGSSEQRSGRELPPALAELVGNLPAPMRKRLLALIDRAALTEPVLVDTAAVSQAVRPYLCVIDHVGPEGVKLSAAGYLPPRIVESIFTELGMDEHWIGKGNREDLTPQVLRLRESAQRMGLLRKHRGRLDITSKARGLSQDPVALWWHLAERVATLAKRRHEQQAGLLYLVAVAAGAQTDGIDHAVAQYLAALGWVMSGGGPCTAADAARAAYPVKDTLDSLGLRRWQGGSQHLAPEAIAFARAALQDRSQA